MQKNCITPLLWAEKSPHATFKKTPIIMKSLFFACLIGSAGLVQATNTYAQTTTVSLHVENQTVGDVLKQIESKTEFSFFYNNRHVDLNRRVSVSMNETNIFKILDAVFNGTDVVYQVVDNRIVLSKRDESLPLVQQSGRKITGTVLDATGMPVIGANVMVKGTTNGTITDMDGKFSLDVEEGATLVVSYIGFANQEIKVGNQTNLSITMKEDAEALDELIVVGYGTMKKKDLTGAVASVKMDDTPIATISTVSHALAGKAAGLQVSTISAQPGGQSTFRIRGAASSDKAGNDPLIIIDGFPVNDSGSLESGNQYNDGNKDNILGSINPNDIESIEVLKDASSTAIYGARAGNGVIIVTTKRGKTGAAKVSYSGSASVQDIAKSYEMLDATGFMQATNDYTREQWMRTNGVGIYGGKSIDDPSLPTLTLPYTDAQIANPANNTNWFDEISRLGFQTSHNLSVSGGTDNTKYLVSGNYFKQDGVIKNNGMERYSLRANLDQTLSRYVKMGVNLNVSRNDYDNVPLGSGQNENASILVSAAQFNPVLPIRNANGEYSMNTDASFLPNPVSLLEINDKTRKERFLGNVFFEIRPIKDLMIKANFGIDRNYQKRKQYMPTTTLYGQRENGSAYISQADNSDYLMELTANYTKTFGDHNLNILAGHSYQKFDYEWLAGGNNNFLTDGFLYNNLGAGNAPKPTVGSSATVSRMASFFGRVNYSFKDRYLLTATVRTDGSSNFADGHRWGIFPSIALGWRFTEEEFLQPLSDFLSNGKLRVSYGETGNSNVEDVAYSYYQVGYNNIFNNSVVNGVYLSQLGNSLVTWETSREWNIGLDLGFLNNNINITAEYYHKTISDLLNEQTLLSYNEVNKIIANVGKTQSQGFELTVNTTNIRTKNFTWTTDLTFSLYRDKWKERDPKWKPNAYDQYNGWMRYYAGYLSDGLVQPGEEIAHMPGALPGQVKIKDIDGYQYAEDGSILVDEHGIPLKTGKPDGKLDDADKVIYGSADPGYLFGFNNSLRWKNFDFNIYFYGQFDKLSAGSYKKQWISNNVNDLRRGYNQPVSIADVWTSSNPNGTLPGYFQTESAYGTGDYYYEKTWFIRCRNITLGYNIPIKTNKHILSNIRVYFDVNNPFIITPYTGLDPETDISSADSTPSQLQWAYPNVRTYSFGLDITF